MALTHAERMVEVRALKRAAPRDRILTAGILAAVALCAASWAFLDLGLTHPVTGESRFALRDGLLDGFIPYPLRETQPDGTVRMSWDNEVFFSWLGTNWSKVGWSGVFETVGISVLAIVLAALLAMPFVLPAARNIACGDGFLPADRPRSPLARGLRFVGFVAVRSVLIVLRAIPEYLWAFLLLILLGPVALAGILALALHNAGILAKLTSETVEDMEQRPLEALAGLGGGLGGVSVMGVVPRAFRQFLVYFFYRWETCIRETAVLGILAIQTIGLHIEESFDFFHYDSAVVFILINSVIVVTGDLLGSWGRRAIRRG